MRRVAWVVVVVLAVAALAVPAWEPAVAQPATPPTPDFDHDGFGDLAVGAPGEDVRSVVDAGAVSLVSSPASDPDEELLYQGIAGVTGTAEAGDAFGHAVAVGDFNSSDGIDSLAVGAPGEDVGDVPDAGVVNVRYAPGFGGPGGCASSPRTVLRPATASGRRWPRGGSTPSAATPTWPSAPGGRWSAGAGAGAVSLVLAGDSGFTDAAGAVEPGARFGAALSVPFFHETDVLEDLGAGAPGETVGGRGATGAGSVLFGGPGGVGAGGSQFFHQGVSGLGGVAESTDVFAAALG